MDMYKAQVGNVVRVRTVFMPGNGLNLIGKIVHIIPPLAQPDKAVLKPFFQVQEVSTALRKAKIPGAPSKYLRVIVETRPGRCWVFPVNSSYTFERAEERDIRP